MVNEAKEILSKFAVKIPQTVIGPEKVNYIIEHVNEIALKINYPS